MPASKRKETKAKPKAKPKAKNISTLDAYDAGLKRGYRLCEAGTPRSSVGLRKRG